jgi:hypothetical protein
MLRHGKIATLVLSVIVAMLVPAQAQAFDDLVHPQLTENAMSVEGFSGEAIAAAQALDMMVDLYHFTSAYVQPASGHAGLFERVLLPEVRSESWPQAVINADTRSHFYGADLTKEYPEEPAAARMASLGTTQGEAAEWARLERAVGIIARQARDEGNPEKLVEIIGISLHQVQDFYAHSNWVEPLAGHGAVPGTDGPGWAERGYGSNPTWFDVPEAARNAAKVYSADTSDGSVKHRVHGDWSGDGNTGLVNTMAKDWAGRPLFPQADMTAYFATRQWLQAIRLWVNDDAFWEQALHYHVPDSTVRCELHKELSGLHQIFLYSGQANGEGEPPGGHDPGPGGTVRNLPAVANLAAAVNDYFSPACRNPPSGSAGGKTRGPVKTQFRQDFEKLIVPMAQRNPAGPVGSVPSSREMQRETRFVGLRITKLHADGGLGGLGDPNLLSRLTTVGLMGNEADMYANVRINDEPSSSAEIYNRDDFSFPRPWAPFTWLQPVPVATEEQEPVESIEVEVKTSCDRWSGTDDDVSLVLGPNINLALDKDFTNDFERCDRDTYSAPIDDLVAPGIQDENTAEAPFSPLGDAGHRSLRVGDITKVALQKAGDGLGGAWKLDGVRVRVNHREIYEHASLDRWLQDGHLTWTAPDFQRTDPRGSKIPVSIFLADDDGSGLYGLNKAAEFSAGAPLGSDDKGDLNDEDHNRVLTIGYPLGRQFCREAEGAGKNGGRVSYEWGEKARIRYCLEMVTPEPPPVEPPPVGSQPVAPKAPPARPDLIISELTPSFVTVENLGSGAAGPFHLSAFNGSGEHTESFTGLAAGASATRPLSGMSACEPIEAAVDDLEQVAESNESNNSARTEEVGGSCPGVRLVPDVIGDGEALAQEEIRNAGFAPLALPKPVVNCDNIGLVVSQSPRGGTSADPGATVTLSVGARPKPPQQCQ